MRRLWTLIICCLGVAVVRAESPPEGFVSLIGDSASDGWRGATEDWKVVDGALIGTADGSLKSNRFIVADIEPVRNFELQVEVWVSQGGNSGLQYRSLERPDLGPFVVTGYQCDVVSNRPEYNGMLYEERGRRILAHTGESVVIDSESQPWIVAQREPPTFPAAQWHQYRVVVRGNHHQHWIDGVKTVDVVDLDEKNRRLEGVLGVQVHVGPPMEVRYRNFFLKRLPDNLPLLTPQEAPIPDTAEPVEPQGGWKNQPRPTRLSVQPPYYRVRYEPSDQPGELIYGVSYTLWIPPGVETLRGLIVHQHGCGVGACKGGQTAAYDWHWQTLARKHQCGLIGPSYEQPEGADCGMWCDPRNGSDARFRQALTDLATQSQHPEVATVPWALWGHSGGGVWAGTMWILHPERVAAVWLRSGTPRMEAEPNSTLPSMMVPEAALEVPVMCNLGTQEGVTVTDGRFAGVWGKNRSFFHDVRGQGGLIGVAVDPTSSHDCGNSRYLAIPWFDACLAARLPVQGERALKPMPTGEAWLAGLLEAEASPAAEFEGDMQSSVWLPDARVAKAYTEYVRDGNVADETPPPAPRKVERQGTLLTWQAEADLESGIAGFVIERDGVEIARIPDPQAANVGRPVLQRTSYHDTPTPPLAALEFRLSGEPDQPASSYSVRTVNSVGRASPSAPAAR